MAIRSKRFISWLISVISFLLLMPLVLGFVVSLPRVQTALTNYIAQRSLSDFGVDVEVGKVRLTYSLDLVMDDTQISKEGRKMISIGSVRLNVDKFSYRDKILNILTLTLEKPSLTMTIARGDSMSDLGRLLIDLMGENIPKDKGTWSYKVKQIKVDGFEFAYDNWNEIEVGQDFDWNHIHIKDLNADLDGIISDSSGIGLRLSKLTGLASPDFQINDAHAQIRWEGGGLVLDSLMLRTANSELSLEARLDIDTGVHIENPVNKYRFKTVFHESKLDFGELAIFIPQLKGMTEIVRIDGSLQGTLSNLKARDFRINVGRITRFVGDIALRGLPNIQETFINLNVDELITSIDDLSSILLPGGKSIGELNIPEELHRLGNIRMEGYLTGFYYDFVSDASFVTDIGVMATDIALREGTSLRTLRYDGKVLVKSLDLGTFLDMKDVLGMISMNAIIKGTGLDAGARFTIEGVIDSVDIRGYNYDRVALNGEYEKRKFNGKVNVVDDNIDLDFKGWVDFKSKVPSFDFAANVNRAYLTRLRLMEREGNPSLKTRIEAKGQGGSWEDLTGTVKLEGLAYSENGKTYRTDSLSIQAFTSTEEIKSLSLTSEILDAHLTGRFKYAELEGIIGSLLHAILPSLNFGLDTIAGLGKYVDVEVTVKKPDPLLAVINPEMKIQQGMYLKGRLEHDGRIDMQVTLPSVLYDDQYIKGLVVVLKGDHQNVWAEIRADHLFIADSLQMIDVAFSGRISADSLYYDLSWMDSGVGNATEGLFKGFVSFNSYPEFSLSLAGSHITVNHNQWDITHSQPVVIDTSMSITLSELAFISRNMELRGNGILSRDPSKTFSVTFVDYDLSDLDFIINQYNVDLSGIISGDAVLRNFFVEPNITGNLYIKGFELNNDKVGDVVLKSNWNKQKKAIELAFRVIAKGNIGSDTTLAGQGYFYPSNETNQLDIEMNLRNFRIQPLKYYLSFFSSDIHGTATGWLKLTGTTSAPVLVGKLNAYNTMVKVDYLNTYYAFADEIILMEDRIIVDSVVIQDNNGPQAIGKTAVCNGAILHKNLKDWRFDLTIETQSLTCLNTTFAMNEYFYGRAVAGGIIRITGPDEDIRIEVTAKTDKGTAFNVPLTYPEDVSQIDFIQFVSKDSILVGKPQPRTVELWGMTMDFDLELTPDAQLQLIFDEKIGDVIKGFGSGDISMELNERGDLQMFGTYEIQRGEYLFTMKNVVNKAFTLKPGGVIRWNGDPYEGELDLEATYMVYTSVYNLGISSDTNERNKRVPVECRLYLTGNFNHPNIERSIEFPGMNTFEAEQYKAAIQPKLSYQFLALLVMNSFLYAGDQRGNVGSFAGSALGTGYSEFLSNQVSNWLSQISNDFDIGLNYRPQDQITKEQVQVLLSTQLFNDRLSVDGNFDLGREVQGSMNTSNIVGDVNIEYKITPGGKFRVRAFNRSNYGNIIDYKSPYTQGVGIFYRKEFDTLKDLFKKKESSPKQ